MFPHAWVTAFFMRPVSLPLFSECLAQMDKAHPTQQEKHPDLCPYHGGYLTRLFIDFYGDRRKSGKRKIVYSV